MNDIRYKDWPALFKASPSGGFGVPSRLSHEEFELYSAEAFLWWLKDTYAIDAVVQRRPDREIRNSPQPDFECVTSNGSLFSIEISRVHNPSHRMERVGRLETFVNTLSAQLAKSLDGRWLLSVEGYNADPAATSKRIASSLSGELVRQLSSNDSAELSQPLKLSLRRRADGPPGIMASYSTTDRHSAGATVDTLKNEIEAILTEAHRKFSRLGTGSCCVLIVSQDSNTLGSEFLPEAFTSIEKPIWQKLGGVFWLRLARPHVVVELHRHESLFTSRLLG